MKRLLAGLTAAIVLGWATYAFAATIAGSGSAPPAAPSPATNVFSIVNLGSLSGSTPRALDSSLVNVSRGKPARASSALGLNRARRGNDGALGTRWAAASRAFPQWWRVDLKGTYDLRAIGIRWHRSSVRSYRYRIYVGNGSGFRCVADTRSKRATGRTLDRFAATARYVKVKVLGSSAGHASMDEVRVYAARPATKPRRTPLPTPSPVSTPTAEPGPTSSPSPTLTPSPPSSPSPTDGPAVQAVVFNAKDYGAKGDGVTNDANAVSAAMKAAAGVPGAVVYLPRGVYACGWSLTLPNGVDLAGAGIYRPSDGSGTWLKGTLRFGSDQSISDLRLGATGTVSNVPGARGTTFERVRFRGGSQGAVVFLGSFSRITQPVGTSGCSYITFRDCEFERPLGSDRTYAEIEAWTDWRAGGGTIHHLVIEGCHFGVSNGSGTGCGRVGFLIQASPNEYYFRDQGSAADWGVFLPDYPAHTLHHDILIKDCVFERSYWTTVDFTDFVRAYSVCKWGENPPSPEHRYDVAARCWASGMNLENVVLKGVYGGGYPTVCYEVGRDSHANDVEGWSSPGHSLVARSGGCLNVTTSNVVDRGDGVGAYTPSPFDP